MHRKEINLDGVDWTITFNGENSCHIEAKNVKVTTYGINLAQHISYLDNIGTIKRGEYLSCYRTDGTFDRNHSHTCWLKIHETILTVAQYVWDHMQLDLKQGRTESIHREIGSLYDEIDQKKRDIHALEQNIKSLKDKI